MNKLTDVFTTADIKRKAVRINYINIKEDYVLSKLVCWLLLISNNPFEILLAIPSRYLYSLSSNVRL